MSNTYGSGDAVRRILEAYLASQNAADPEAEAEGELAPMLTGEQQNFAGMVPSYDLEGDPYSMTAMLNQLQDVNQLLADPLFQAGGGSGAFSQEAFAPTVSYEVVDSPEYQRWKNYINTPESPEGMIAAELQGGGTPRSAIRKIQAKVLEDPEGPLAQELATFFPAVDFDGVPTGEIDWTVATEAADEIDEIRSKIPPIGGTGSVTMPDGTIVPGGEIMEVDGQLVKRIEEPSEQMEHFAELGLPSPFEEYTAASFLGPEWQAQDEAWLESEAALEPYNAALQEAYQAMLANENWSPPVGPAPAGTEAAGGGGGTPADERVRQQPGPTAAELNMIQAGRANALAEQGPIPPPSILDPQVIPPLAEQLIAEGHELPPHWTYTINPDGTVGEPLPQEYLPGGTHGYEEPSPSAPEVEEPEKALTLENAATDDDVYNRWLDEVYPTLQPADQQAALRYFDEVDVALDAGGRPPIPPPLEGTANLNGVPQARGFMGAVPMGGGVPANATQQRIGRGTLTPAQAELMLQRVFSGEEPGPPIGPPAPGQTQPGPFPEGYPRQAPPYNVRRSPDADVRNQILGQQGPRPDYMVSASDYLQQQAEGPGPDYSMVSGPDYLQQQAQGPPSAASMWPPTLIYDPWTQRQGAPPRPGVPAYAQPGAQPARQPGDESYRAEREEPTPPYAYSGGGRAMIDAMVSQVLPGNDQRSTTRPPHPASMWPPTTIYDPWAPQQATEQTMRENLGEEPPSSAAAMWTPSLIYDPWTQRQGAPPHAGEMRTGERTAEERKRLAQQNTEEDWEYDPTTGNVNMRTYSRNRFKKAYKERSHALVARQQAADQIYGRGSGFGESMAAVYRARLSGATPLQQTYAQRVQNVANAGIPIGAQPGLISY